ncbi:TRAP transporter small permease subunit [Pseudooceanicola aestuarii]|uniref:TRAP transporter small permease subunit n=1 Tax=Pseudooceanicola aestuarii TaxID=2697319 RepID=UPI0013D30138|nr:TRAP transporter small permease [Pseudooceanicola aestuarii]
MTLFARLAGGIAIAANAAGTLVVIALIAVVNYDILARSLFNRPFLGAVEVVQFAMVLIVFLQLPDVIRVGRLTRSDGFLGFVRHSRPRAWKGLAGAIDLTGAIFMALVAWTMWPEFLAMWESRDYFGVQGVFTAPWWPIKLVIFASACLCMVHFLLHIFTRPGTGSNETDTAK